MMEERIRMPHYYFDVRDGKGTTRDETGMELPSLEAAISQARRTLLEIAVDEPTTDNSAVSIDIREDDASLVTVVSSTSIMPSSSSDVRSADDAAR
jgi:hypothetical protein